MLGERGLVVFVSLVTALAVFSPAGKADEFGDGTVHNDCGLGSEGILSSNSCTRAIGNCTSNGGNCKPDDPLDDIEW